MWDRLESLNIPPATIPVALVAFLLLLFPFANARRSRKMEYTVKWGRERLRFPLPSSDANLAVIRHAVAEYTQLPEHSFKLVHAGSVMKDDNQPISAYGIRPNSTIALVGDGQTLADVKSRGAKARAETKAPKTEESTIAQIQSELSKVRGTLLPDVDTFLATLPSAPTPTSSAPAPAPATTLGQAAGQAAPTAALTSEQDQEHLRLGELLLQTLLRLDAVNTEGEWLDARRERKVAVKEVQGLLDRLDGEWKKAKARAQAKS